jgi:hypothetical protein
MIKRICCLGSATLGALVLAACGSSTPIELDKSVISTGDNNATSTGGYFWTYSDHNDPNDPLQAPYHSTVHPLTNADVSLQPVLDDDTSSGHGKVLQITGSVPTELPWPDVSTQAAYTIDKYWKKLYPDATVPAYPAAGMGFGFQDKNKPFDATFGGKYIGVAFDMKTGVDGMQTVWVSFPMVGTDLPDIPNNHDAFPAPGEPGGCTYYTSTNDPVTGYQTCFANYRKGILLTGGNEYNTLAPTGTWKRYCVLFSEVGIPNWANQGTKANDPAFDPTKILKMQWDMFQPKGAIADTPAANFDIKIDNVKLINKDEAKQAANNCNQSYIGLPPGTDDAGMN